MTAHIMRDNKIAWVITDIVQSEVDSLVETYDKGKALYFQDDSGRDIILPPSIVQQTTVVITKS